jgi:hypothetical protein
MRSLARHTRGAYPLPPAELKASVMSRIEQNNLVPAPKRSKQRRFKPGFVPVGTLCSLAAILVIVLLNLDNITFMQNLSRTAQNDAAITPSYAAAEAAPGLPETAQWHALADAEIIWDGAAREGELDDSSMGTAHQGLIRVFDTPVTANAPGNEMGAPAAAAPELAAPSPAAGGAVTPRPFGEHGELGGADMPPIQAVPPVAFDSPAGGWDADGALALRDTYVGLANAAVYRNFTLSGVNMVFIVNDIDDEDDLRLFEEGSAVIEGNVFIYESAEIRALIDRLAANNISYETVTHDFNSLFYAVVIR